MVGGESTAGEFKLSRRRFDGFEWPVRGRFRSVGSVGSVDPVLNLKTVGNGLYV